MALETSCFFHIVFKQTLLSYYKKKITTLCGYIKINSHGHLHHYTLFI